MNTSWTPLFVFRLQDTAASTAFGEWEQRRSRVHQRAWAGPVHAILSVVQMGSCKNTVRRKQPILVTKRRQRKWPVTNLGEFIPETSSALTVKGWSQEQTFYSSTRVSPDPFTNHKNRFRSVSSKLSHNQQGQPEGVALFFFFCFVHFLLVLVEISISRGKIVIAYWKQMFSESAD